jgi:methyltransferase family protein
VTEHRLFDPADPPEWLDPEWWRDREHCDHLGSPTGAHVARLQATERHARIAALTAGPDNDAAPVCDLGAGDGALLSLLPASLREKSWGYDTIRADVEHACKVRGVEVLGPINVADTLARYPASLRLAPVVVLTEVLEHMADPHGFLALLHARPEVRFVVASSPHSETPEQHEWNHAWAWDIEGYQAMFNDAGFTEVHWDCVEWSQVWTFEAVRDGITDLDPMVAQLLAEGRKAGLP